MKLSSLLIHHLANPLCIILIQCQVAYPLLEVKATKEYR